MNISATFFSRIRAIVISLFVLTVCSYSEGRAESPSELIEIANTAMDAGDYTTAEAAVGAVIAQSKRSVARAERAEAFRILGLVKFYASQIVDARRAFLEYLLLDPDAHLDPALVAPEAIALLEDVRSRNLAEIDLQRKKPKRYLLLNVVPGAGQFQNGERTKGYLLAGGIGLLLGTNIASYLLLKRYCDSDDLTCSTSTDTANNLQSLNIISGIGAISLYIYSVVDGYQGYRRLQREDAAPSYMSLSVTPNEGGATVGYSLMF